MGIVGVFAVLGRLLMLPVLLVVRLVLFLMQFLWLSPFILLGLWLYHRNRQNSGGMPVEPLDEQREEPTGEQMPHFRGEVKTVSYREVPEDEEAAEEGEK